MYISSMRIHLPRFSGGEPVLPVQCRVKGALEYPAPFLEPGTLSVQSANLDNCNSISRCHHGIPERENHAQ